MSPSSRLDRKSYIAWSYSDYSNPTLSDNRSVSGKHTGSQSAHVSAVQEFISAGIMKSVVIRQMIPCYIE